MNALDGSEHSVRSLPEKYRPAVGPGVMRRTKTVLLVGALLAALTFGALAPAVSAHSGTDSQPTPYADADNATEARAQYMAQWMAQRMGPEGVAAFEEETGTTIEAVAYAMAEHMGPWAGGWGAPADRGQYAPGEYGPGSNGPGGYGASGYGPGMPCGGGNGHGMGGYGQGMGGGW